MGKLRDDLRNVKTITNLKYVRFHGVLMDDVGVYREDKEGRPECNLTYVDQIYDGLLRQWLRPFVEISFIPENRPSAGPPQLLVQAVCCAD